MPLDPHSSAFPSPGVVLPDGEQQGAYAGVTVRAYVATEALAVASARYPTDPLDFVAGKAVALADALIAALSEESNG